MAAGTGEVREEVRSTNGEFPPLLFTGIGAKNEILGTDARPTLKASGGNGSEKNTERAQDHSAS